MKIEIDSRTKNIDYDKAREIVNGLSIQKLMELNIMDNLYIGVRFTDAFDRELLFTPFGAVQTDMGSMKVDNMDGGLVSCGIFDLDVTMMAYQNFDVLIEVSVDLISTNDDGYLIIDDTSYDLDISIEYPDREVFKQEMKKCDYKLIPRMFFKTK